MDRTTRILAAVAVSLIFCSAASRADDPFTVLSGSHMGTMWQLNDRGVASKSDSVVMIQFEIAAGKAEPVYLDTLRARNIKGDPAKLYSYMLLYNDVDRDGRLGSSDRQMTYANIQPNQEMVFGTYYPLDTIQPGDTSSYLLTYRFHWDSSLSSLDTFAVEIDPEKIQARGAMSGNPFWTTGSPIQGINVWGDSAKAEFFPGAQTGTNWRLNDHPIVTGADTVIMMQFSITAGLAEPVLLDSVRVNTPKGDVSKIRYIYHHLICDIDRSGSFTPQDRICGNAWMSSNTVEFGGFSALDTIAPGDTASYLVAYSFRDDSALTPSDTFQAEIAPGGVMAKGFYSNDLFFSGGGPVTGHKVWGDSMGTIWVGNGDLNGVVPTLIGHGVSMSSDTVEMYQFLVAAGQTEPVYLDTVAFMEIKGPTSKLGFSQRLYCDIDRDGRVTPADEELRMVSPTNDTILFAGSPHLKRIPAGDTLSFILVYEFAQDSVLLATDTFQTEFHPMSLMCRGVNSNNLYVGSGGPYQGHMVWGDSGSVTVAAGSQNGVAPTLIDAMTGPNKSLIMYQLEIAAGPAEPIYLDSIYATVVTTDSAKLSGTGHMVYADIDRNGTIDATDPYLGATDLYPGVSLRYGGMFSPLDTIAPGDTANFLLMLETHFDSLLFPDDTFRLEIDPTMVRARGVHSNAVFYGSGAPLHSRQVYGGAGQVFADTGAAHNQVWQLQDRAVAAQSDTVVMLQFELTADTLEDLYLDSVVVRNVKGSNDRLDPFMHKLYWDVDENGAVTNIDKYCGYADTLTGGLLRFGSFFHLDTLEKGKSKNYLVTYHLSSDSLLTPQDTLQAEFYPDSVLCKGKISGQAVKGSGSPWVGHMIWGGSATVAVDLGKEQNVIAELTDHGMFTGDTVELLQFEVAAGMAEALLLDSVRIRLDKGDGKKILMYNHMLYADVDRSGTVTWPDRRVDWVDFVGDSMFHAAVGPSMSFDTIGAGDTATYLLVAIFRNDSIVSPQDTFRVELTANGVVARGRSSNSVVMGPPGPGLGHHLWGLWGDAEVDTGVAQGVVPSLSDHGIAQGGDGVPVLQFSIAADPTEPICLDSVYLDRTKGPMSKVIPWSHRLYLDVDRDGLVSSKDRFCGYGDMSTVDSLIRFGDMYGLDTIQAGDTATYLATINFHPDSAWAATDTFQFFLESDSVRMRGVESQVKFAPPGLIVSGHQLWSANGTVNVLAGSQMGVIPELNDHGIFAGDSVIMMQFEIAAGPAEPVYLDSVALRPIAGDRAYYSTYNHSLYLDVDRNGLLDPDDLYKGSASLQPWDSSMVFTYGSHIDSVMPGDTSSYLLQVVFQWDSVLTPQDSFMLDLPTDSIFCTGMWSNASLVTSPVDSFNTITVWGMKGTAFLDAGDQAGIVPELQNHGVFSGDTSIVLQFKAWADSVESMYLDSVIITSVNDAGGKLKSWGHELYCDVDNDGAISGGDRFLASSSLYTDSLRFSSFPHLDTIEAGDTASYLVNVVFAPESTLTPEDTLVMKVEPGDLAFQGLVSHQFLTVSGAAVTGPILYGEIGNVTLQSSPNMWSGDLVDHPIFTGEDTVSALEFELAAGSVEDAFIDTLVVMGAGPASKLDNMGGHYLYLDVDKNGYVDPGTDVELAAAWVSGPDTAWNLKFYGMSMGYLDTIRYNDTSSYIVKLSFHPDSVITEADSFSLWIEPDSVLAWGMKSGASIPVTGTTQNGVVLYGHIADAYLEDGDQMGGAVTDGWVFSGADTVVMHQFKIYTDQSEDVLLDTVIVSNMSGDMNKLRDPSYIELYADVDNDGLISGADAVVGFSEWAGSGVRFHNFGMAIDTIGAMDTAVYLLRYAFLPDSELTASDTFFVRVYADSISARGTKSQGGVRVFGANSDGPVKWGAEGGLTLGDGDSLFAGGLADMGIWTGADSVLMHQIELTASAVESVFVDSVLVHNLYATTKLKPSYDQKFYYDVDNSGDVSGGDILLATGEDRGGDFVFYNPGAYLDTLEPGQAKSYLLMYAFAPDSVISPIDTFRVRIDPTGISAIGATTNSAVSVEGVTSTGVGRWGRVGSLTSATGDSVGISPELSSFNISGGDTVLMHQFNLTVGAEEPIYVDMMKLGFNGDMADLADASLQGLYCDVDNDGVITGSDRFLASASVDTSMPDAIVFAPQAGARLDTLNAGETSTYLVQFVFHPDSAFGTQDSFKVWVDSESVTATGVYSLAKIFNKDGPYAGPARLGLPVPTAVFSGSPLLGNGSVAVTFSDLSTGTIDEWIWDYGDGSADTFTTATNPTHTYTTPGTYSVSLTVSNGSGGNTATETDYVTVYTTPVPLFGADGRNGIDSLTVAFSDSSTGDITEWIWVFGDGTSDTLNSSAGPVHLYESPGLYDVKLTVSNAAGSFTNEQIGLIGVYSEPLASFSGGPVVAADSVSVTFTDLSLGDIELWVWNYGDGTIDTFASATNPTHTYTTPGQYDVTLIIENPGGADTLVRTSYVSLYASPVSAMSGSAVSGIDTVTVTLVDSSTGEIDTRIWDYGDGTRDTFTVQTNPTKTYALPGTYTVTLITGNPAKADTLIMTDFVTVYEHVTAAFDASVVEGDLPLTVAFTNQSTGSISSYMWVLDGDTAFTSTDVSYTYTLPGAYDVKLVASGPGGSDTLTMVDYITVSNTAPVLEVPSSDTLPEDSLWVFKILVSDANGDIVTLTVDSLPEGATFDAAKATLSWTPGNGDVGTYAVTILAADPHGASDTAVVTLTVVNVNDVPSLDSLALPDTVYEDNLVTGYAYASDIDAGDEVSLVIDSAVSWLSVDSIVATGTGAWLFTLSGTPRNEHTGLIVYTIIAVDAHGDADTITDTMYVVNTNDPPETTIKGKRIAFGAVEYTVTAEDDFDSALMFHAVLQRKGDMFVTAIDSNSTGTFEFYPLADGDYVFTCVAQDQEGLRDLTIQTDSFTIKGASTATLADTGAWCMFSAPAGTQSAGSIKAVGKVSHWDESSVQRDIYNFYVPSSEIRNLHAGKGYWGKLTAPATVDIPASGLIDSSVVIPLYNAGFGWNQIASPFPYPVVWDRQEALWRWDAILKDYVAEVDGIMDPWQGYLVNVEQTDSFVVGPTPTFSSRSLNKRAKAFFMGPHEWRVQLVLTTDDGMDADNVLGVSREAKNGKDMLDRPEPPRIGGQPYLYFSHPEWRKGLSEYASDIRASIDPAGSVFDIAVAAGEDYDGEILLRFKGLSNLDGVHLYMGDENGIFEVTPESEYRFGTAKTGLSRTVFVTTDPGFITAAPSRFAMALPYPNPARPNVHLQYTLPYRWAADGRRIVEQYEARLTIHDARGNQIRTLVHRKQGPGHYSAVWNGKSNSGRLVPAGTYFCRLEADRHSTSQKVIVVR